MTTQHTKGFTLIEILIAIAVCMVVFAAVVQFQVNILRWNATADNSLKSLQSAQTIIRTMVKELRSAKPGNNGAYTIAEAATTSLTFYSDIDADGLQEQVHYFLSGTVLKKGVIKPAGNPASYSGSPDFYTLATGIYSASSTDLFQYYDATYTGTSSPLVQPVGVTTVRLIKINFTIDADPNRPPAPQSYTSEAMLRNLKDNL